jgi:rod shape determining protein RodA
VTNAPPIKQFHEPDAAPRVMRYDLLLALAVVGLMACSVYTLWTATQDDVPGDPYHYVVRQAIYACVGIAIMLVIPRIDYSRLRELRVGLYALTITSILLVYALGAAARGSKRWIELPFFRFQPSELGKVLLILALAGFAIDRARRVSEREHTSRVVLLALLPAALVIAQPELGTGLVYVVICSAVLFISGTKWTHFAALGALAVAAIAVVLVAAPAAGVQVLKPYQLDRLTAFLNPSSDPQEEGYQLRQSIIGIGSGEKTGRGPEEATQTKLDFLPEHHTDFIFSVVGETFGFLGAALVLSLYALLIWRCLRILTMSKNLYGAVVAGGIVAMLMFQVFVNVGMTIGIMPITGVPLPLLSYGGSSVLVTFIAVGLLQSIHAQARQLAVSKQRDVLA